MKRLPALLALVVVLVLVLMLGTAGMVSADTITFDDGVNLTPDPLSLPTYLPPGGSPIASVTNMTWDGGDYTEGHLYCSNFVYDSAIYFTDPKTYVHSFQLNGMPTLEVAGMVDDVVPGPLTIEAFNAAGVSVWSYTVPSLGDYYDLQDSESWLTVDVNTAGVSSIIFYSPNPIDWETYPITGIDPNGPAFYASIDDLVITAAPIPASVWLMVSGLVGLVGLRRKFTC